MDEQRRQAYLELTQELLSADGSRVSEILDAKREWVDAGWVDMLEQVATHLVEQGNSEGALSPVARRSKRISTIPLMNTLACQVDLSMQEVHVWSVVCGE